jgi:HKD family nuclease
MSSKVKLLDAHETGERVKDLAHKARDICIISPFISEPGVRLLMEALKGRKKVHLRILTRADALDVVTGATNLIALKTLLGFGKDRDDRQGRSQRTLEMRRRPEVHAKLYVFDNRHGIIGSSNLSQAGLAANLEVCCHVTDRATVTALRTVYFSPWFDSAIPLDHHYLDFLEVTSRWAQRVTGGLDRIRRLGKLRSVRIPRGKDFFDSTVQIVRAAQRGLLTERRLKGLLERGFKKGEDQDFNPEGRVFLLEALGIISREAGRVQAGAVGNEVLLPDGRTRLWKRMKSVYPNLERVLACFRKLNKPMRFKALAKAVRNLEERQESLSPECHWLVALGHLNSRREGGQGRPYVFWLRK